MDCSFSFFLGTLMEASCGTRCTGDGVTSRCTACLFPGARVAGGEGAECNDGIASVIYFVPTCVSTVYLPGTLHSRQQSRIFQETLSRLGFLNVII
eukprot:1147581-Pelagomonas_calceolata.AAC.2